MAKTIYQMETGKRAKPNRFEKGITGSERYGTNRFHDTGVPMNGFKGESKGPQGMRMGIRMPGQANVTPRAKVTGCAATTKKGNPCQAAPIKGTDLCVGHTKQSG
jgi:hypothetical protein